MDKHRYRQAFEESTSKLCQEEFKISLHWLNSPIAIPSTKQWDQEVVWAISCNNLKNKLRYKTKFDKHCRLHTFIEGDLVRIHMRKEQFFNQPNANDSLTDDGLFRVVHKTDIFTR